MATGGTSSGTSADKYANGNDAELEERVSQLEAENAELKKKLERLSDSVVTIPRVWVLPSMRAW